MFLILVVYAYEGVKFRTEVLGNDIPNDTRLCLLERWCLTFHEKGIAPPYDGGSYGNLSFRIHTDDDSFIITASHSGLGESTSNNYFVTVPYINLEQGIVYARGTRLPSSESMVHYAIYRARPEVNAIFHGHCDVISKNAAMMGIPVTKKEEPYGTIFLVNSVLETLDDNCFIEMRNHGFLSLGKTMNEAGSNTLDILSRCEK